MQFASLSNYIPSQIIKISNYSFQSELSRKVKVLAIAILIVGSVALTLAIKTYRKWKNQPLKAEAFSQVIALTRKVNLTDEITDKIKENFLTFFKDQAHADLEKALRNA